MNILKTPSERFENLPGYPFEPHYAEVDGLQIHFVDEGPRDGAIVLMMHGEPSWSFLYRHMIPVIAGAGHRAIAPDLIGFGKSDKPAAREDYTYQRHVDWMTSWMNALDLHDITLVCQDWGSLIGLRMVAENPDRFGRVVLANGGLPTGDQPMPEAFQQWQHFSQTVPVLAVGEIIDRMTTTELAAEVIAGYDAPFPDETYKAGARAFPMLVPSSPDDPAAPANRAAWQVLATWQKPFLTAFSDGDPITAGYDKIIHNMIPGAKEQPHTTIVGAGHFLQEDKGPELAKVVIDFMAR